ncbi:MAG: hypothetical protein FJ284_02090 [Planctomycetes bacterium]|nr:hypothetical protein [Planctomycetota bacterium]
MPRPEQARRDEGRANGSLASVLRREAVADRPAFSEPLHDRIMRRVTTARWSRPGPKPVLEPPPARRLGDVIAAAVSAAAVVVALLMTASPDGGGASRGMRATVPTPIDGTRAAESPSAAVTASGDVLPTIDRLPTLEEIEESVNHGVASLAASLFEVPDWTALAELDITAGLEATAVP